MLSCNNCDNKNCREQRYLRQSHLSPCYNRLSPKWLKANTLFENLIFKDSKQAETCLQLLHEHQIDYRRYT
jgi:hypothetical protein